MAKGNPCPRAYYLPVHDGRRLPRPQAGPEVRRGPHGAGHHVRGEPQPPAAAGRHGDGVDHGGGGVHAAVRLDAQRRWRQPDGGVQLPGARGTGVVAILILFSLGGVIAILILFLLSLFLMFM
jgi:hypothetical protein